MDGWRQRLTARGILGDERGGKNKRCPRGRIRGRRSAFTAAPTEGSDAVGPAHRCCRTDVGRGRVARGWRDESGHVGHAHPSELTNEKSTAIVSMASPPSYLARLEKIIMEATSTNVSDSYKCKRKVVFLLVQGLRSSVLAVEEQKATACFVKSNHLQPPDLFTCR
ncbi:hypothetical protein MUK42_24977 [Musa troglodytarum]|uniref:Uncharacterized protein n=1 Tax=Musa troglodytarum TaxID=320322 RepID=A0A9E7F332_9LILI|nr:hypothetical protein MUK42_24977 [Musa troglodytarum]URD87127.1 hypothetical protein MUK42_24977 [Musa troglodytarum]